MSTPAEQQQALDELQTPASLDRITRFLSDLGEQGNAPLGTSGRSAQAFAASLAGGAHSFSARQASGWVAILMDRYQIKIGEIQEFALWFVRRQGILSQTIDLVERAPEPVLARPSAPEPTLVRSSAFDKTDAAPAVTDGLPQTSPGTAPPRTALRRQAVTTTPPALPPSESGPAWETEPAAPAAPEERPRRRQVRPGEQATVGAARSRRIERSPVKAGDDTPPGDLTQQDAPQPEMPDKEAPPTRRPFRLTPNMITRPAFVTNVGLAGMLAGLSLAPSSAMAQDAPDMALASLPIPGSGPMGGPLPTYSPLTGTGPLPMYPNQGGIATLGVPAFTPTVTPLVTAAATPPPSTVWLGMPASPLPVAVTDAAPGPVSSPSTQMMPMMPTPGIVSPTPLAPDMTLLPGMSPDTLGVQEKPAPQAGAIQPAAIQSPTSAAAPQMAAPRLPSDAPASALPLALPPVPSAVLPDAPLLTPPAPQTTPSVPGLMGLAAGSAALVAAEQLRAHRPQAASGDAGQPTTGGDLTLATPLVSADSTPATLPPSPSAPVLMGLAAGSAALAVADRLRGSQSQSTQDSTQSLPAGVGLPPSGTLSSPMTVFMGSKSGPTVSGGRLTTSLPDQGMTPAPAPPIAATPEMGQMTLIAPPLQIASAQAERGGIAASVDWQTLAGGAGPLDEGGLARLKQALPVQASVLYPALPPGSLGQGAVNLPLSAPLVQSLLQKAYGNPGMGLATRAADMGASAGGGKSAAAPLTAQLVPGRRPAGAAAGVFGHPDEVQGGAGALGQAGKGQAARGGVLDFLGLPVRLAPSLGGRSELARETTLRTTGQGPVKPQQTLRPEQFAPLRNRLFPAFSSMAVEPDKAAWRKAAPAFGLRDGSPTTLLAPDARVPVQTPTAPQPPSHSQPPVSSPSAARLGGPHAAPLLSSSMPSPSTFSPSALMAGHKASGTSGQPGTISPLVTHGLLPAIGAGTAAHTPLNTHGITSLASHRGASLSLPVPHSVAQDRLGAPMTDRHQVLSHPGPGLGLISTNAGHHIPLGPSLHLPSGHPSSPFGHPSSSLGLAHLPSGPAHKTATPGSLLWHGSSSGMGPIGQNHLTAKPRAHGGTFSLPTASRAGFHAGKGSPATLPMALPNLAARSSGHRLPLSDPFNSAGGRSGGHSRPAHTNARPWGDSVSLPASRPVPASSMPLGTVPGSFYGHGGGEGRRSASPLSSLSSGLPSAALALPRRAVTTMRFPNSRIISSPGTASPATSRANWPIGLPPTSGRQRGTGVAGSFGGLAPAMRLAPPRTSRRIGTDASATPPMTIQRSETTTTATPAQNRSAQAHAKAPTGPSGSASSEVNALAGEVWSLLKRRLATEAERRGR